MSKRGPQWMYAVPSFQPCKPLFQGIRCWCDASAGVRSTTATSHSALGIPSLGVSVPPSTAGHAIGHFTFIPHVAECG
eukprot:1173816-Lingulodinium_polyedra.AAC.1